MKKFVDGKYLEMDEEEIAAFNLRQSEYSDLERLTLEINELRAEIERLKGE